MSKINKIRVVNLNYNYNTMKIDDEEFYLDGENTMLNLRNGGGKSVLVQMITAPFVNKRYRNTKDRTFESYFTTSSPTHILIEWKLDDGAGYLLTGMMVRKKEATSDENSKETLDIINYIHEYKDKNENDIKHIPIIENKDNRKILRSFTNCKIMFEELKKDRLIKFFYYDMNNYVTTKQYFNKLEEYKINYREWETIIKQINIKESGLSELFTKAKDSSGLVKEWFLPAVENKLKIDEDRIDNYRKLLEGYIKQYRQNKSNIDKKARLELFNDLSIAINASCEEFISTVEKKEATKNYIANVIGYLRESLQVKEGEEKEIEGLVEDFNRQIEDLKYEEESIKVYKRQEEIHNLELEVENKQQLLNESEEKKESLKRKINILECTKIHRDYQNASRELQEQETKLTVLNKKNEDNGPRIKDLGFNIRGILQRELENVSREKSNKQISSNNLIEEKETINRGLKDSRKELSRFGETRGKLTEQINSFDKQENSFNSSFDVNLYRNIEGYFDDKMLLNIDKTIKEEEFYLHKERQIVNERIIENEENLKGKESEKLRTIKTKIEKEHLLANKNSELDQMEEEICSRRDIIKYIDFEEERVFDNESIIDAFERKVKLLSEEEGKLNRTLDSILKELNKLKTGKVLELPKEIEEKLKQRDISITYGMEWLKKNGYSFEKNEKLVESNPFIPYSLVMDSKEIALLEREGLEVFTSSPIGIINRTELEKSFENLKEGIVNLDGISFLVSFNNKLLNEAELLKLIVEREAVAQTIEKNIEDKKGSIKFYEDKRNVIRYSHLTLEAYQKLRSEIEGLKEEDEGLRQLEIELEKEILAAKDEISGSTKKSQQLKDDIRINLDKAKTFKDFMEAYDKYKKNRVDLERNNEILSAIQVQIDSAEIRRDEVDKGIIECSSAIQNYTAQEINISKELSQFNIYSEGALIEKDKEDLLSEFNALIKDITSTEQELREKIGDLSKKFKEVEQELVIKTSNYQVKESEYINESYDLHKELEIKGVLKREEAKNRELLSEFNSISNALGIVKNKLEYLYASLKDNFNREEPKPKSTLIEKDFKLEIEKLKLGIKEENIKKEVVIRIKSNISNNLTSLNEYNDLNILDKVDLSIDIRELDNIVGKLKRDLNNIITEEGEREKALRNLVVDIEIRDEFRHEGLFMEPIQTLKTLISRPLEFKEQLELIVKAYRMLMDKLMADIELIEKEEHKILESILEYIKDVHENIERIDVNSSITIGTKRIKMLNISAPDWEENKGLYSIRLKEIIEKIRNLAINALEQNEDIEDIIGNNVNINKLYDEVVGIGAINIKLYKIEEDRQREITWNEVSKNSGGEGFLSAFVILSSLLSYMRRDETDIFSRKEGGKVIIMDNPFAQTSSAHLLKPLIDIAKKSNTQLICLTGLGGDSIYNRFDNIYVLNLISSKLKNNVKYLISGHIKGSEEQEQELMVSSRFKIEEQMRLF